jgi:hypothetical protein
VKKIILLILWTCCISTLHAQPSQTTQRIPQFSNSTVKVWKTIIYPSTKQTLAMHRHDSNRVLVALTNGVLKITNNQGRIKYLHLKKDKAYFLEKDVPKEIHSDENISAHPIKVMVIELRE